jgi:hypothetical protein
MRIGLFNPVACSESYAEIVEGIRGSDVIFHHMSIKAASPQTLNGRKSTLLVLKFEGMSSTIRKVRPADNCAKDTGKISQRNSTSIPDYEVRRR